MENNTSTHRNTPEIQEPVDNIQKFDDYSWWFHATEPPTCTADGKQKKRWYVRDDD